MEPAELRTAARVADALVYVAGVAGTVAGGLLLQSGELPLALVVWVLTFVAGALLRLVAWCARALAVLLARTDRIERDLGAARVPPPSADAGREPGRPADPYRRWGGFH